MLALLAHAYSANVMLVSENHARLHGIKISVCNQNKNFYRKLVKIWVTSKFPGYRKQKLAKFPVPEVNGKLQSVTTK